MLVARYQSVVSVAASRKRVWDMAIEQFIAMHHGVCTIAAQYSVT